MVAELHLTGEGGAPAVALPHRHAAAQGADFRRQVALRGEGRSAFDCEIAQEDAAFGLDAEPLDCQQPIQRNQQDVFEAVIPHTDLQDGGQGALFLFAHFQAGLNALALFQFPQGGIEERGVIQHQGGNLRQRLAEFDLRSVERQRNIRAPQRQLRPAPPA